MSRPEPPSPPSARRASFALAVVSVAGLVVRLIYSRDHPLDHNGGAHVFIARNFSREYENLAHPPLFPLLLKASDAWSHSLIAYRFFPILASVGSIYLVGRILERLGIRPAVAVLGAAIFAFASSSILLAFEVEGYTLCVFFVLASFLSYLELVRSDSPRAGHRIAFAGFASLALLSHYFAGLYLLACTGVPLLAFALVPADRAMMARRFRHRWVADLATLLAPALVGAALYVLLARPWVRSLNNMPSFYFRPGEEPLSSFWIRNLRETFNLFSPVGFGRARRALPWFGGFLAVTLAAPALERRRASAAARSFPALFLVVLLLLGMTLGALGRYPFGGLMRHQFLIFLFAVLAGCVAVDILLSARSPQMRLVVLGLLGAALAANFGRSLPDLRTPDYAHEALVARRGVYRRALADVGSVHVDQFNLIGMMMDYYSWDWRFVGRERSLPSVERYELTRNGRRLEVVAHRYIWLMDFRSPSTYSELRQSSVEDRPCFTVFSVQRNVYGPPWTKRPERKRTELTTAILALAASSGLEPRRVAIDDHAVCVDFCRRVE